LLFGISDKATDLPPYHDLGQWFKFLPWHKTNPIILAAIPITADEPNLFLKGIEFNAEIGIFVAHEHVAAVLTFTHYLQA